MLAMEEVRAAERVMREAQRALLAYAERPSGQQDRGLHRRVAVEEEGGRGLYKMALALDSK